MRSRRHSAWPSAVRTSGRSGAIVRCLGLCLGLMAGWAGLAQAQGLAGVPAHPVAFLMAAPSLSSDELADSKARGLPPPTTPSVAAHGPTIRLWDEVGLTPILPHQGTVTITTTGRGG